MPPRIHPRTAAVLELAEWIFASVDLGDDPLARPYSTQARFAIAAADAFVTEAEAYKVRNPAHEPIQVRHHQPTRRPKGKGAF